MAALQLADYDNVLRSCQMLYFHFGWGLFLMALGIVTIVSRLPLGCIRRYLKPWHAVLGQSWMYGTIIEMATSLYCRADGFRTFIFGFLVILVVNMIVAHASIRIYQRGMSQRPLTEERKPVPELQDKSEEDNEKLVCGIRLVRFMQLHAICMCLAYAMLFGAGVMFIRRSQNLRNCKNFYARNDAEVVTVGSVIFELDGALILGGQNFTDPSAMRADDL